LSHPKPQPISQHPLIFLMKQMEVVKEQVQEGERDHEQQVKPQFEIRFVGDFDELMSA